MLTNTNRPSAAREWLVSLMSYAVVVAPFGCQLQLPWLSEGNLTTSSPGLFLNSDTSAPLVAAGRSPAGAAFYVFGTRQDDGAIAEVDSVLIETAAGQRSFVVFELGRPVYVQGPDGSYVQITYAEVSPQRLAATAKVYDARTGKSETVAAEIDLQAVAEEVAAAVEQLTGRPLAVPEAPAAGTAKVRDRAGLLSTALAVVPLFLLGQVMVVIAGQLVTLLYDAVVTVARAAVLAAFTPVFLLASLLGEVTVRLETVPLLEVLIELPLRPLVEVVVE